LRDVVDDGSCSLRGVERIEEEQTSVFVVDQRTEDAGELGGCRAKQERSRRDITRNEVQALVDDGVPYIQLDSIRYVFDFTDEERRRHWQPSGVDADAAIDENVEADNAVQGNVIEWDDQRHKLELLVDTARKIWGA
jgi:hypothetical protein